MSKNGGDLATGVVWH